MMVFVFISNQNRLYLHLVIMDQYLTIPIKAEYHKLYHSITGGMVDKKKYYTYTCVILKWKL